MILISFGITDGGHLLPLQFLTQGSTNNPSTLVALTIVTLWFQQFPPAAENI
jgi:hypothetical protein